MNKKKNSIPIHYYLMKQNIQNIKSNKNVSKKSNCVNIIIKIIPVI